jgi:hypothetical protein
MPIQINLMTDALAEQELRKRDPAKRAVYVGVLLVVMMLVWYSSILLEHMVAKSNLDQVQAEIQARTNEYNLALASLRTLHTGQSRLKSLDELSSARFLQGNLMNALQQLYVSNVNLMRIEISQHYAGSGADAKTAAITESTLLTLDSKDSSPNPGDQVNHYKDAIAQLDFFKTRLIANDGVKLSNLSPPQSAPGSSPSVLFTITCRFIDQIR